MVVHHQAFRSAIGVEFDVGLVWIAASVPLPLRAWRTVHHTHTVGWEHAVRDTRALSERPCAAVSHLCPPPSDRGTGSCSSACLDTVPSDKLRRVVAAYRLRSVIALCPLRVAEAMCRPPVGLRVPAHPRPLNWPGKEAMMGRGAPSALEAILSRVDYWVVGRRSARAWAAWPLLLWRRAVSEWKAAWPLVLLRRRHIQGTSPRLCHR